MFKSLLSTKLSIFTLTVLSSILPFNSAQSITFQETEVNQSDFIVVAQPYYGGTKYNLIVVEQIPGKNTCWKENGSNPVNVDLLLLNFDFSGHCRRSTDANGYSIRYNGQDYGLDMLLNLENRNGNLTLVGVNRKNPGEPPIVVGSAQGINGDAMKIHLNPGWRFSKRTYEGKVLGHVYFSYDSGKAQTETPIINTQQTPPPLPTQGTIREIVSPDVQPRKQQIKPVTQTNQPVRSNLSRSGWDRW